MNKFDSETRFEVISPCDGKVMDCYMAMDRGEMFRVAEACEHTWNSWRCSDMKQRGKHMMLAAKLLRQRKRVYGQLITREMGKTLTSAISEVEKCAWVCEYYAERAPVFLADEAVETEASQSWITYQPLGPVLAVMPWNFPFWQVFRFAAPALMAGNTALLKHASNVPGTALAIEQLFRDAGFPEDTFRTLLIRSSGVAPLIEHPAIKAVTLTGSGPAGRAVACKAGEMLKKCVLELGGSDPYIILKDADLDRAASSCATARLINAGQSCIAAKRFIVVDEIYDAFREAFLEKMRSAVIGDPLNPDVALGPMARTGLRDELHDQVSKSMLMGASCLTGGVIPDRPGAWYPPTVLEQVVPGMPAFDEELFGPVAALIRARDESEAVQLANQSVFGLGAAVFTRDLERGRHIAEKELQAGCCAVNDYVRSDPRLPFGGIKESGFGRELSLLGIREFVNIKSVYIA